MRVKLLADETVRLDKINSKTYPAGWSGEVDDTLAKAWLKKRTAERLPDEAAEPKLTDEETLVLKQAAQAAMAAAKGKDETDDETFDPETGELDDAGGGEAEADEGDGGGEQTAAETLASMEFEELKALAKQHDVTTHRVKREAIEAALLAKLEPAPTE